MRAVGLQPDAVASVFAPTRELFANEGDLFPEVPHDAGRTVRGQLDDRCDDLDHPAVEVDGATGRKLQRGLLPWQQGPVDECAGMAPEGLGIDLDLVQPDIELGLHADHRQVQSRALQELILEGVGLSFGTRHEAFPGRDWTAQAHLANGGPMKKSEG